MIYSITSGTLTKDDGTVLFNDCYAGGDGGLRPDAVNNPQFCNVHNVGPLPIGIYTIGPLVVHGHLGPAMALTPDPSNSMFGRSAFYVHYNNPKRDAGIAPYPPPAGRNSSDGCVVIVHAGGLIVIQSTGETKLTVGV